jgi:hypothetical protein
MNMVYLKKFKGVAEDRHAGDHGLDLILVGGGAVAENESQAGARG